MPLTFVEPQSERAQHLSIFLSASIPDPNRWIGTYDALEITDAVVAFARVFLTAGARLVSAAHPTIAPLLLYVAAELQTHESERVVIYQSQLFEDALPSATRRFEADGIGRIIWTQALPGNPHKPESWGPSLELMRQTMLAETEPSAAVFVGGMYGVQLEYDLYTSRFPTRPTYPVGRPGGEARLLLDRSSSPLRDRLMSDSIYPAMWRSVLEDLLQRS
jgi:SLOG cluster3 family